MIKAIVFDYAGVLIEGPLIKWMNEHIKDEAKRKAYIAEITTKGDIGKVNFDEFLALVSKRTGIPKRNVLNDMYHRAALKKDVFNLIEKLKKKYVIALFSNNQHEIVCEVLQHNNVLQLFDEVIISSRYKLLKPQQKFYQKMLSILHLKKDEIIFIDDKQENIDGAKRLGITAFLFTNAETLQKDLASRGIVV